MFSALAAALKWSKKIEPVNNFTWEEFEQLKYPCRLKREHFDCKSDIEGAFEFEPGIGSNLTVGKHTLIVTFLPNDEEVESQCIRREVEVMKATPEVSWKPPTYINEGTPLGRKQLNAACINLPGGEYNYTPDIRTTFEVGEFVLRCVYEPEPEYRKNYGNCVLEVPLKVVPMITPTMVWPPLEPISYEDVISKENIMTATTPGFDGRIAYDPPEGTLLQAGPDQLVKAMFTPYNRNEIRLASLEQLLTVKKAIPRIEWPQPAPIYTGTELSEAQLNATNDLVPSETALYRYDPPFGASLEPGERTLSLTFTPDEKLLKNYEVSTYTRTLTVLPKKEPIIDWAGGAEMLVIFYGEELGRKNVFTASSKGFLEHGQVTADPQYGGHFSYSPKPGTMLQSSLSHAKEKKRAALFGNKDGAAKDEGHAINDAEGEEEEVEVGEVDEMEGLYEVTLTFTPHNTVEWETVHITKPLLVRRAELVIEWNDEEAAAAAAASAKERTQPPASPANARGNAADDGGSPVPQGSPCSTTSTTFEEEEPKVGPKDLLKNLGIGSDQTCATLAYSKSTSSRVRSKRGADRLGDITYNYEEGHIFSAGEYPMVATFTPHNRYADNFNTVRREEVLRVVKPSPGIHWPPPPTMYRGHELSDRQLNARCPELQGGRFYYEPPAGTELPLGRHVLRMRYEVAEAHVDDYKDALARVEVDVKEPQMPELWWTEPEAMPYNSPLSQFQLNATCSVQEGFFYYDPPRGTVLEAGESHTLRVTWTPDDHFHWLAASKEVQIYVYKADPQLDWELKEPYYAGMPLEMHRHLRCSARDLHLTDGDMHYSPGAGARLGAGTHTLSVTYTPPKQWRRRYNKVTKSIVVEVKPKQRPPIEWANSNRAALDWNEIVYGTKLSTKHLNATVQGLEGEFVYDPPLGTILDANTTPTGQVLSLTFTPKDREKYLIVTETRSLRVEKATPQLEWHPKPLPFMYIGKELTKKTCNASTLSRHPESKELITGRFVYCPPVGEVLPLGQHTLTVIFQPHEEFSHNYTFSSKFIIFPVIEVGSLFRLPKRYTDPEPRPHYQDDREYADEPLNGPHQGKFFFSEIDTVTPSTHDRKIAEKKSEEERRRREFELEAKEAEREKIATR